MGSPREDPRRKQVEGIEGGRVEVRDWFPRYLRRVTLQLRLFDGRPPRQETPGWPIPQGSNGFVPGQEFAADWLLRWVNRKIKRPCFWAESWCHLNHVCIREFAHSYRGIMSEPELLTMDMKLFKAPRSHILRRSWARFFYLTVQFTSEWS